MYYLEAHLLSKDCNKYYKPAFLNSSGIGAITESGILEKITVSDEVPGKVPLGRVPSATETFRVVHWVKEQGSPAPGQGSQEVTHSKNVSGSDVKQTKCGPVGS